MLCYGMVWYGMVSLGSVRLYKIFTFYYLKVRIPNLRFVSGFG